MHREDEAGPRHNSEVILLYHLYLHNLHYCRKFCAEEWCALNPEGTVGAFNLHWDEVQKEKGKMDVS